MKGTASPESLPGAPPVQWTLLQGEGRDAADKYNSIYRIAFQERGWIDDVVLARERVGCPLGGEVAPESTNSSAGAGGTQQ